MASNVKCKNCGAADLWWSSVDGRWKLKRKDTGEIHYCEGKDANSAMCKFCNASDLHWFQDRMEDGTVRNTITESYGLPHFCKEREDFMKAEWKKKSDHKKQEYASRKTECDTLVAAKKMTAQQKSETLYRLRKLLWPNMGKAKKSDTTP